MTENNNAFQGLVTAMKLRTDKEGFFGLRPEADTESEQELSLNSDGSLELTSYNYGEEYGQPTIRYQESKTLDRLTVAYLLSAVGLYFAGNPETEKACDAGSWELELTNDCGQTYHYQGSTVGSLSMDGSTLSKLFRKHLSMPHLLMFDAEARYPIRQAEDELIFVSVVFDDSENEYCYICDDPLIQPDDRVIVPAGRLDDKTPATVVKVEVLKKENAPYPIGKCKKVICREE